MSCPRRRHLVPSRSRRKCSSARPRPGRDPPPRLAGQCGLPAPPEPALTSAPSPQSPNIAATCGDASGSVVAPVAPSTASPSAADTRLGAAGNAATTPAASESNEDGGASSLRVAEIVLAATLLAI